MNQRILDCTAFFPEDRSILFTWIFCIRLHTVTQPEGRSLRYYLCENSGCHGNRKGCRKKK
jgi:hypothetical protein